MGKKICPETMSKLLNECCFENFQRDLNSKIECSKNKLEKEHLTKIKKFYEKRNEDKEFQECMVDLETNYSSMKPSDFWTNERDAFEQYLKTLESNRKTFVWRSGALEDAILSSDNYLEIIKILKEEQTTKDTTLDKESEETAKKTAAADFLKKQLKERLDDYTRKKLCKILMNVKEIQNFLSFIAKEETKPETIQLETWSRPENSASGHADPWLYIISKFPIIVLVFFGFVSLLLYLYITSIYLQWIIQDYLIGYFVSASKFCYSMV